MSRNEASPVLHVVCAGEIGGAERMLVDLAKDATHRRHVVALRTPNQRLYELFRDSGLDVEDRGRKSEGPLSFLTSSLGPSDVAWLTHVANTKRARIVHVHTFASQVLGTRAARRLGARLIRTEHSTRVYDDPSCWPFSRWSLARADAAVCISRHVEGVLRARAPWASSIATVVPNGVDVERFRPSPDEPRAADLPIPGERLRLVAIGRLDARKGLDVALEALSHVPDAELAIVGDGDQRAKLVGLARSLGITDRVHFTGYCDDVRPAVARAHVVLSSARTEGLGIALLEAMAMGRPVVALPTGGIPEFVEDGVTGWLAEGPGADALARALKRVLAEASDLRRRGQKARERVVSQYSVEAMRQGYERLYARLDTR